MNVLPENICNLQCVSDKKYFKEEFQKVIENESNEIILSTFEMLRNTRKQKFREVYRLQYSPVGNYTPNPVVIICGKTTSGGSHDLFIEHLHNGESLHNACVKSIFSNMKHNLFKYLLRINFFEFMQLKNDYWRQGEYKDLWDKIFEDSYSSIKSGIQLTQACNCAILNANKSKRSSEPPGRIFRQINGITNCFFKHLHFSSKLQLIIFLDTPSNDSRFHQIKLWDEQMKNRYPKISVISITHPSPQNNDVYNYLDDLSKMTNIKKKPNAIKLFYNATDTINRLIMENS